MEPNLYTILIQFIGRRGEKAFVSQVESTSPLQSLTDMLHTEETKSNFDRLEQRMLRHAVFNAKSPEPLKGMVNVWTCFVESNNRCYLFTIVETKK